MKKILIVEDEKAIVNVLKEVLVESGYEVEVAYDGIDGFYTFQQKSIDLILTDIMMPKLNGGSLIEMIRKQNTIVPIIAVTALSSEEKALEILSLGADDFISKPFSIPLLLQKINKLIKKTELIKNSNEQNPSVENNFDEAHKTYYDGKNRYNLTSKEYEILKFLYRNSNSVVSRDEISKFIWGDSKDNNPRNVDNHIRNIRKKIPGIRIQTYSKEGYKLVL